MPVVVAVVRGAIIYAQSPQGIAVAAKIGVVTWNTVHIVGGLIGGLLLAHGLGWATLIMGVIGHV